jgi:hypothetical protein
MDEISWLQSQLYEISQANFALAKSIEIFQKDIVFNDYLIKRNEKDLVWLCNKEIELHILINKM